MKVVILNAGRGSRLGERELPKALTPLDNGQTILGYQLAHIREFCPQDAIILVVGYRQELIRTAYPNLHYVENPQFAQENTSKSLLRALETIPDEDILWLNGDVLFRREVLPLLFAPHRTAMVVNRTQVGEEEVKYHTDGHGRVVEISKTLDRPEGESLGIHYFCRKDVPALLEGLRRCQPMDYFEAAIQHAIEKGTQVSVIEVADTDCLEIDFPEDLALANQRLKLWDIES